MASVALGESGRTRAQRISAADGAALVGSGDWVEYGTGIGRPAAFDAALAARVEELRDVKIRACLSVRPRAVLEADPGREHFHWFNWHFTGYDRVKGDAGCASYIPCNLGEIPDYYRRFIDPPEIAVLKTCRKDEHGFYNFSLAALWHRAIIERARIVIVEESAQMPYLDGVENAVHESEVDYVIAGDDGPPPEVRNPPPTDADRAVAKLIAADVEDGSCLQVGIGAMPNAVCSLLRDSGVRDLGVHTEMLTDGIVDLYLAGVVTGARKTLDPGKVVCTFGLGTATLYETADRNPDFLCHAVDLTNPPHIVMQNDRVVAINSTTQMDLPCPSSIAGSTTFPPYNTTLSPPPIRAQWRSCRVPGGAPLLPQLKRTSPGSGIARALWTDTRAWLTCVRTIALVCRPVSTRTSPTATEDGAPRP